MCFPIFSDICEYSKKTKIFLTDNKFWYRKYIIYFSYISIYYIEVTIIGDRLKYKVQSNDSCEKFFKNLVTKTVNLIISSPQSYMTAIII